ncbi:MAG: hypothetical protein ACE5FM_00305, partial [Methyloligellaceae bacterium]
EGESAAELDLMILHETIELRVICITVRMGDIAGNGQDNNALGCRYTPRPKLSGKRNQQYTREHYPVGAFTPKDSHCSRFLLKLRFPLLAARTLAACPMGAKGKVLLTRNTTTHPEFPGDRYSESQKRFKPLFRSDLMKKHLLTLSLLTASIMFAGPSFAMDKNKDAMMKEEAMKKEAMMKECEAMKKDAMMKDGMKKDTMMKKDDMMKKEAMMKECEAMEKEAMMKDGMKKDTMMKKN